uniref:Ephrin RBD domain-containing protein n=1 Tax=Echinostoma caproni TaxID=27848 RepID=A0A183B132_9TREM
LKGESLSKPETGEEAVSNARYAIQLIEVVSDVCRLLLLLLLFVPHALQIAVELDPVAHRHNIFHCPVIKEVTTASNGPVRLTCGHAISRDAFESLPSSDRRYFCLRVSDASSSQFLLPPDERSVPRLTLTVSVSVEHNH